MKLSKTTQTCHQNRPELVSVVVEEDVEFVAFGTNPDPVEMIMVELFKVRVTKSKLFTDKQNLRALIYYIITISIARTQNGRTINDDRS